MSKSEEGTDSSAGRMGVGITVGAASGAVFGLLFDDITQGVVIGVVTGMTVALVFEKRAGRPGANSSD